MIGWDVIVVSEKSNTRHGSRCGWDGIMDGIVDVIGWDVIVDGVGRLGRGWNGMGWWMG